MPALGRIVNHDPRSRRYLAPVTTIQRSVVWGHHAPVLDQGQLGSCTGNALAQCLNTDKYVKRGRYLNEADAVRIYSAATLLDDQPGQYPPEDTGSSGLAVCKAAQKMGYLSSYSHAFGFNHFTASLQLGPIIVGTEWHSGMNETNAKGFVKATGAVEGGHEYLALGVLYETKTLVFLNSWGDQWGQGGRFYMSFATFQKLLAADGDATIPAVAGP